MRLGYIFAGDYGQYQLWLGRQLGPVRVEGGRSRGLAGADLERVLYAMSMTNPDIVTFRVAN